MPLEIKEENQEKARKRIFVEHIIRLIKIFRIARERFRLKDNNYQIHNYIPLIWTNIKLSQIFWAT